MDGLDFYRSCPACGQPCQTRTGFWSHLRLSRNPRCQAAHDELLDSIDASGTPQHGQEAPAARFGSDAFGTAGDYVGDDFGQEPDDLDSQSEDGSLLDSGPDSEDEQRLFDLDLEDGWEPERPSTLVDEPTPPVEDIPLIQVQADHEDADADLHDTHLRLLAEERAHSHP